MHPHSLLSLAQQEVCDGWARHCRYGCAQDVLDPAYRQLNRDRSARAAAKTRTMQVLSEAPSSQMRPGAVQRVSFGNKASTSRSERHWSESLHGTHVPTFTVLWLIIALTSCLWS